jgi:hypothetical protein
MNDNERHENRSVMRLDKCKNKNGKNGQSEIGDAYFGGKRGITISTSVPPSVS